MLAQEKNIKGFNVLEVIVVLAIVGLITAVAYPKISHWNAQRQVDTAATKIKTLFTNINSQVQRGNYGFVQVYINSIDTRVDVFSKGMKTSTLAQKINGDSDRFNFFSDINHMSIPFGSIFRRPIYSSAILYYKIRDYLNS